MWLEHVGKRGPAEISLAGSCNRINVCGSVSKDGPKTSAAVKVEVNQESGKIFLSAANWDLSQQAEAVWCVFVSVVAWEMANLESMLDCKTPCHLKHLKSLSSPLYIPTCSFRSCCFSEDSCTNWSDWNTERLIMQSVRSF